MEIQRIPLPLAAALAVIAAILGLGAGYSLTPEYRLDMYDKSAMDLGRPDRGLDLRYLNAMIAHHRSAMLLSEQSVRSERPEIKELAAKILSDEPKAIAELYEWKREWYGDIRTVKDPVVPRLGDYDDKFDLRFLNALIAHHENGLYMTSEVKTKSSRNEVLNNADAVENFLSTTLNVLKGWRKDWYNI